MSTHPKSIRTLDNTSKGSYAIRQTLLGLKHYPPMDYLGLSIALHRKTNIKRCDRICVQTACILSTLQYVISESPVDRIAFFPIVFHRHAGVLALGIQLGIRESHADRKRHVFSGVKYESPISNFYLQGGALPQKSSHWLLINDCCLSSSQRLAGVGHKAKPLLQGLARGRRIQRKPGRLLCGGYCGLSRGTAGQQDEQGNDAYSLHDIFGAATLHLSGRSRHILLF